MSSPIASVVHLEQKQNTGVETAIRQASQKTGVDFSYLLAQATTESGLNPNAKAGSSTAAGLYQFIERTWLDMVDRHGAEYGLEKQAAMIARDDSGRPYVNGSVKDRKAILDLRYDPEIASMMAGEYAAENRNYLEGALSQKVQGTDLYFAHFLGAGGAARFLRAMEDNPSQSAAAVLPEAAAANHNIFYDKSGKPRSLQQVYDRFESKFSDVTIQADNQVIPPTIVAKADNATSVPSWLDTAASGQKVPTAPYMKSATVNNVDQIAFAKGGGNIGHYWHQRGIAPAGLSAFANDTTIKSLLRVLETDRDGLAPTDDQVEKPALTTAAVERAAHFGMQGLVLGNLLQAQLSNDGTDTSDHNVF